MISVKYGPQTRWEAENSPQWQRYREAEAQEDAVINNIQQSIQVLARGNHIQNPMSISFFLNPSDEAVADPSDVDIAAIAEAFSPGDRPAESDEDEVVIRKVKVHEALEALDLLSLHEEQQEDGDSDGDGAVVLKALSKHWKVLNARKHLSARQMRIDQFLI